MTENRFRKITGALFSFSRRESRRVLLLLPLLVVLCLLFVRVDRPRFEQSFTRYSDRVLDSMQNVRTSYNNGINKYFSKNDAPNEKGRTSLDRMIADSSNDTEEASGVSVADGKQYKLFRFDPNTVSLKELVMLGFSPKQAQVILNYRQAGAVFRVKRDFARCYTVSSQKYAELEPYIEIGEPYRTPVHDKYPQTDLPPSAKENGLNKSNESQGEDNLTRSKTLDDADQEKVNAERIPQPILIELNEADSATLVAIRGIGPLTAGRVIRYRDALGGFASVEQLQEIQGMTERNYLMIRQQIFVDSSKIQKIDINFALPLQLRDHPYLPERVLNRLLNFASPKRMQGHPYLPPKVLNKILKYRQLKGGWSSTKELIEQHILPAELAVKLDPYFSFGSN